MVKHSPIARSCRVYVTTRFQQRYRFRTYEIMHLAIHWGRVALEDTPQRRRLGLSLYLNPGSIEEVARLIRAKIEVSIAPSWKKDGLTLFQGYIDDIAFTPSSDGYVTVDARAVEGAPHDQVLLARVSGVPAAGTVSDALKLADGHMRRNNAGPVSASMSAAATDRLYPANHKQKPLTAKQWYEAVAAAAPGSHAIWSPDFRRCQPSTYKPAVSATTYAPTLDAATVIAPKTQSIPLHYAPRNITIVRSGAVVGPKDEEYVPVSPKENGGPSFVLTSDYGIFNGGTETFAQLWKLQKTTPRQFTVSDHNHFADWPLWQTMEYSTRIITIPNDPIANLCTAPPHFTPIGGTLKITPTKTTHTLHCIWRTTT